MKRLVTFLVAILAISQLHVCMAQRSRMNLGDREKWLSEMRSLKHDFLVKELGLSREQQDEFFPVYDEMDDELNRINTEMRALEKKVTDDPKATDTEIESASRTLFEQKQREGQLEMAYYEKFKKILKPRQLLKLKDSERKFTKNLVKLHGRTANP